jgi:hypothetical protein
MKKKYEIPQSQYPSQDMNLTLTEYNTNNFPLYQPATCHKILQ